MISELASGLGPLGMMIRGGFHADAGEMVEGARTVLLIGNAGSAMWKAFARHIDGERNPLDRWTKSVIDPIAEKLGARALYPFGPDAYPFQRWAKRAETIFSSPLGILIHPEYGLWHAYRAALLFAESIELPPRAKASSPCDSCADKPCLSACPVGAFDGSAYDVAACAGHIAKREADCASLGCHARDACPVGAEWRYPEAQIHFHLTAFRRSVTAHAKALEQGGSA